MPVGVIGPSEATTEQIEAAFRAGYALANAGMTVVCGGKGGVMQAVSKGCHDAGGIVVGVLPEEDDQSANAYLTVALPTGMGEMRNALIARSSACLIAIGGGVGTLSEIALGLKMGKAVFAMLGDIELQGVQRFDNVDDLVATSAAYLCSL
jgi:uncharacterized protein (TIGR00725 family)